MAALNDIVTPSLTFEEILSDGSTLSNPAADGRRLFLGEDGLFHMKDSAGTVTDVGGGSGSVAADAIWDAKGDLAGGTGANTAARLAVGANGTILTADSGEATGLKWGAGGAGSMVWLQRQVAAASATLDFTAFISALYEVYLFEFKDIRPATDNTNLQLQAGSGGGPTYDSGSNYGVSAFRWAHNGSAAAGAASGTTFGIDGAGGIDNGLNSTLSGFLKMYNPSGTAGSRRFVGEVGYTDNAGSLVGCVFNGQWQTTTAITAIRFLMAAGNITSGTIDAYGLKLA